MEEEYYDNPAYRTYIGQYGIPYIPKLVDEDYKKDYVEIREGWCGEHLVNNGWLVEVPRKQILVISQDD